MTRYEVKVVTVYGAERGREYLVRMVINQALGGRVAGYGVLGKSCDWDRLGYTG